MAFTSGLEEVVVPFFDPGLPTEYELTRSIRVVSKSGRKKVGILATDVKMLGGFDFRSMGQETEWPFVTELKKQYEVSSVALDAPIPADLDVLLVAQPSSLTQRQIDTLTDYVRQGHPTSLFHDPLPMVNPTLAPELPKMPPGGPFGGGPPPEPKGNLAAAARPARDRLRRATRSSGTATTRSLGQPELPPEFVFVGKGSGGADAFNPAEPASSGLQDMVLMFPGLLRSKGSKPEFTPLLRRRGRSAGRCRSARSSSRASWGSAGINPNRRHIRHQHGIHPGRPDPGQAAGDPDPERRRRRRTAKPAPADVKAIVIADLDLISEHVLRDPPPEDREPRLRQRDLRAQLRRRPGRRRRLRRAPEASAPAPDPD